MSICQINPDCLYTVFYHLGPKEILKCLQVSRGWQKLIKEKFVDLKELNKYAKKSIFLQNCYEIRLERTLKFYRDNAAILSTLLFSKLPAIPQLGYIKRIGQEWFKDEFEWKGIKNLVKFFIAINFIGLIPVCTALMNNTFTYYRNKIDNRYDNFLAVVILFAAAIYITSKTLKMQICLLNYHNHLCLEKAKTILDKLKVDAP